MPSSGNARGFAPLGAALLAGLLLTLAIPVSESLVPPEPKLDGRRDFTLSDVTIVSPGQGRRRGVTLRVRGDRIESIGDGDSAEAPGRFRGATVVPGLI
ncbi:MAG: hypothetical protein ACREQY_19315, partial [Candidatus Binatia bacterium]